MAATLVLSAWEPEIAPLLRALRRRPHLDAATATVGIGAVDAAIGAARAIAAHAPQRVIFVGTAGVYPRSAAGAKDGRRLGAPGIGAAVVASEILLVSTAALRGDGYLPAPQAVEVETGAPLRTALVARATGGTEPARVACPTAITRSAPLARRIAAATGAALENLEAFAVARAAGAATLEFGAVLGVANRVGPAAHREWRAHHLTASRAACRLVVAALEADEVRAPSRPGRPRR